MPKIRKNSEQESALEEISVLLESIRIKNEVLENNEEICLYAPNKKNGKKGIGTGVEITVKMPVQKKVLLNVLNQERLHDTRVVREKAQKFAIDLDDEDELILLEAEEGLKKKGKKADTEPEQPQEF